MSRQAPDPLELARAERDAAVDEFGSAMNRLATRLLDLHDDEALRRLDRVLIAVQAMVGKQDEAWSTLAESLQRIHEAELAHLGATRESAARQLLEAERQRPPASTSVLRPRPYVVGEDAPGGGIWPNGG